MVSPVRIAMWSGPRNISTALMRAFEARGDTVVVDEPLYAAYLVETQKRDHPGFDEIVAQHETDWSAVIESLLAPLPEDRPISYQKHMAHHLLPHVGRDWLSHFRHAFLIRDPEEMLTSLIKVLPNPTLPDTGLPQQLEIFERMREEGAVPPVLDSRDVLENPRGVLERLCDRLGIPFTERMLSWSPGPRDSDGVWARHWYSAVWKSTGFQPYRKKNEDVPPEFRGLLEECRGIYDELYRHRITA